MPRWWVWMTNNLVIGRVPVGSIIAALIMLMAATLAWLIYSSVVDAFPRWIDKVLMMFLGGALVYGSVNDDRKNKRIAELEKQLANTPNK